MLVESDYVRIKQYINEGERRGVSRMAKLKKDDAGIKTRVFEPRLVCGGDMADSRTSMHL